MDDNVELHIFHLHFSVVFLFCIHCSISLRVCPVAMEIYEEMDTIWRANRGQRLNSFMIYSFDDEWQDTYIGNYTCIGLKLRRLQKNWFHIIL